MGVILDPVLADFHDIGLTLFLHICVFFTFENVENAFWVIAQLPQRLKPMFFKKNFFTPMAPLGLLRLKKLKKNIDFSLRGKYCLTKMRPKL